MSNKIVFVAFAIEDIRMRDLLRGQSLHTDCPFTYTDMSVKEAYRTEWKKKVRTRIQRSHGVIALISKNSLRSTGQKWEIACAKEEGVPILGIRVYTDDRTSYPGIRVRPWSWNGIATFIEDL